MRHSMGPGGYGDSMAANQMYSPREMRVSLGQKVDNFWFIWPQAAPFQTGCLGVLV